MITGTLAVVFNALSVIIINLIMATAIINFVAPSLVRRYQGRNAAVRRRLLWTLAAFPWLVALLTAPTILVFNAELFNVDSNPLTRAFHWHHYDSFSLTSWHGIVSIAFLAMAGLFVGRSSLRIARHLAKLKLLAQLSTRKDNGVYQLASNHSEAFTAGFFKPESYISQGLNDKLSEQEYRIVELHELAHARRRDPFKKWCFQLLNTLLPKSTASQLNQAMTVAIEQCADDKVTEEIPDRTAIALTLVKVGRLENAQRRQPHSLEAVCNYSGDMMGGIDAIEARITYLLDNHSRERFPIVACGLSLLAVSAFCAFSSDLIHHSIELLLIH